jgi:hypothetical protein
MEASEAAAAAEQKAKAQKFFTDLSMAMNN